MKLATHLQQSKLIYLEKYNEEISVMENEHYISLMIGKVVQSIMLKRLPHKLTIPHHYFLTLPLLFMSPKHVVELGLGGGNLVRFLNRWVPNINVTRLNTIETLLNASTYFSTLATLNKPY